MDHLRAGSVLGQRVRLVEPVTPGPGQVWRAVDQVAGREVAVKVLAGFPADDAAAQARLRLAMRAAVELSCPGIATVHEYGQFPLTEGLALPYLVRELVPGRSLEERLGDGSLQVEETLAIVAAVADALATAHRAGVVHGHLVPANVVLGPAGVRVTDFGLWVLRDRLPQLDARTGLSYTAPELAAGGPVTPATDMYSLGVLFAACLTGIAASGAAGGASLADLPSGSAAESLASLWAACLGASPRDRPSAAHAAVMSRQMIPPTAQALARTGPQRDPAGSGHGHGAPPRAVPSLGSSHGTAPLVAAPSRASSLTGSSPGASSPRGRRAGSRLGPPRRGGLLALGGVAAGFVAVMIVLAQFLGPSPGRPGAAVAPSVQAVPVPPAAPHSPASPGGSSDTSSSGPASPAPPSSAATGHASPAGHVTGSAVRVIGEIWSTVVSGASRGQIRQDVAVDFENLIKAERAQIAAGRASGAAQFVTALRAKVASRLAEGSMQLGAARTIDGELGKLLRCVHGGS